MEIEAKRPVWRGIQFDSQLEADWYGSMLYWGVDAIHHPGRIELESGWYEPDFLLRNAGEWGVDILLEVKGAHGERLWKAQEVQERNPELVVLVGKEPWISPEYHGSYPGAVWCRPDGSEFEWDLNGRGKTYVSGQLASVDRPGLIFMKTIGTRFIK